MAADQGLVDSVAGANIKTIAEAGAWSTAQVFNSHAAHASRLQILAEAELANSIALSRAAVAQASKAIQESDLAEQLASLGASVAAMQQQMKGAQSTPPETATGK